MGIFKDDALAGKVALVTGGGSGIGEGIARAFLAHGASVAILSRSEDRLVAAAERLSADTGGRCLAVAADVREPEAVEAALARVAETFGDRLDIVVNGAAGNFLAPAAALSYKGFRTVVEIDTLGTFNVTKAAFERFLKHNNGRDALILSISATLHYTGVPFQVHAGAAKAAVDAMTRHLAVEWGPLGIRVNAIAPGPIADTEGMRRLAPTKAGEAMAKRIPLRRFGAIDEVADAAVFLASDAARWITGAVLVVDGGAWMTMGGLGE